MRKKTLAVMIPLALPGLIWASQCLATGYVSEPPARNVLCKKGENKTCDNASLYASDYIIAATHASGFPEDGKIPSGGIEDYQSLNNEDEGLWQKTLINKGEVNISWQLTSPSNVVSWKYYITQSNWRESLNAQHQLTRESFDAAPFCEIKGNAQQQQGTVAHKCKLPERDGYQVIYAVADLAPQADGISRSIYNVVDVDIANVTAKKSLALNTPWKKEIATIDRADSHGLVTVKAGDVIRARFFSHDGELEKMEVRLTILPGEETTWSYHLARAINDKYKDIRAGVLNEHGDIVPESESINTIFVGEKSQLIHAEVSFN
ncbi:lytic polysaccharide monooxygenase [Erwiniaceae bacterium BAC15a-03b]|uniref:Lytic polysaccharide monooxygenase n=1 Tax=Winslowiella arboricola TaxID=2978220 RepID=A0A9J6PYQ8_9GAMM|nr:lytic polysaccharide monooxygenase [Winslowiella arboricola]MCU5773241.1 lytic polysaccharide monooxygenase [Winslowiella arboricola]MCU5779127.1 lytic polysaccharide monooxygenase [Winslowiella arboricola]